MAFTVGKEQQNIFSRLRKMTPANRLAEFNRYQSQGSPTPFTFLTPTQFAELFPKYYMEKLPDVGGFFKALNSRKELGGEGKTYGPHGNTEGTASPSSNERVTNTVRAKEIYEYIRSKAETAYHPCGTLKMGIDKMAVVDENLKIHGLQNIRVVDASVMPEIPSANLNAPTLMIAEKASDIIINKN